MILDGLIKRLEDLERNEMLYKGLIEHSKKLLKSMMELSFTHKSKLFSVFVVNFPHQDFINSQHLVKYFHRLELENHNQKQAKHLVNLGMLIDKLINLRLHC